MKKIITVAVASVASIALLLPGVALAATDSKNTVVNATVEPVISITTSGSVTINSAPGSVAQLSTGTDTVTVRTNSRNGYVLNLRATSSTNLTSGSNDIPATSGTWTAPATMATNSWGYRIDGAGNFGTGNNNFAAVSTTGQNVKTTNAPTNGDVTSVIYGINVNSTQANGAYTGQVTYTATTNS